MSPLSNLSPEIARVVRSFVPGLRSRCICITDRAAISASRGVRRRRHSRALAFARRSPSRALGPRFPRPGFGASAISSLRQGYAQNAASLPTYAESVAEGLLPVRRGIELTADDKLRRHVIERVMCDLRIDVGRACTEHGMPESYLDDAFDALQPMARDGLLTVSGRRIEVTETGRPLVRNVAAAFDAYLENGQGRHSSAI